MNICPNCGAWGEIGSEHKCLPRFSDEQIEAVMEWPSGAMKNVEMFDMTYRVRKVADAAFLAGMNSRAASGVQASGGEPNRRDAPMEHRP